MPKEEADDRQPEASIGKTDLDQASTLATRGGTKEEADGAAQPTAPPVEDEKTDVAPATTHTTTTTDEQTSTASPPPKQVESAALETTKKPPSPIPTTTSNPTSHPRPSLLPPSLTTPSTDPQSSSTLIVPPLNFSMVSRGIYRSGHPNERNFEFLRRLNLKSVLYLGTEDYRSNMTSWTSSQNITTFHLRLTINKEPLAEMDQSDVIKALKIILTPSNWPILIHCNKGKYRVGCIVGLLRRLQGWSHTSIFEEYSRFAGTKISDLEFIEVFDLSKVSLSS